MIVWSLAKREADTEMRQRQIVFAFPNEGKNRTPKGPVDWRGEDWVGGA